MDQRDFRVPVETTRSPNNSSSAGTEGRPRSALAALHFVEGGESSRAVVGGDAVGFHNISGTLGLSAINSDSISDGIQNYTSNGEEDVDAKGNVSVTDDTHFSNDTLQTPEDSKPSESKVNGFNSKGFITKPTKAKTAFARTSVIDSNPNAKSTADLPKLDLTHNLPPLTDTITYGFGVKMVASSSCQQLIYRSVPPRPLSFAFTDVLDTRSSRLRSRTAPVSTNSPEEYAQRFKSRPTTRPRVVEFDGSTVSSKTKRSAIGAAFPTARAKVYIGHQKTTLHNADHLSAKSPSSKMHLAPLGQTATGVPPSTGFMTTTSRSLRTAKSQGGGSLPGNQASHTTRAVSQSANSSSPGRPVKSSTSQKQSVAETSRSAEFMTTVLRVESPDADDHIHNPELLLTSSTDCDDLSVLPPPKKVLPRREVPWVFRYKVKKGMNTLSRIMASRPASQNILHSSYTFT